MGFTEKNSTVSPGFNPYSRVDGAFADPTPHRTVRSRRRTHCFHHAHRNIHRDFRRGNPLWLPHVWLPHAWLPHAWLPHTRLPITSGIMCLPVPWVFEIVAIACSTGAGTMIACSTGAGTGACPYHCHDFDDSVAVIRHDDKFMDGKTAIMLGDFIPNRCHHPPCFIQDHCPVFIFAQ
ncbi:hypothetical protein EDC14_1014110 [Hydrogenispora ethanolica]|uniref:Uncharacterized protein n=1 Tax=Hydrogenispora ethanolica TaxID=1082276 RepID=A0A4R1RND7_HYDET|nr:hypothetical protein EDC14_1014110 [Hydrogenispora ethanolica]